MKKNRLEEDQLKKDQFEENQFEEDQLEESRSQGSRQKADDPENALADRREFRRKRRQRNQITVYISTAVVLIGLVVGAVFGVKYLAGLISAGRPVQQEAESIPEVQEPQEEEPVIVVEAPEEYEEEVVPEEEPDPFDIIADGYIAELTLEEKVAGLFFITPEELTDTDKVIRAGDTTKEKLQEFAVGGLVYSGDNIQSGTQLNEMLTNTKTFSKYPIFLGVNEEGGQSAPVAGKRLGEKVDPMGTIGESGDSNRAYETGALVGAYLSELGFNMNFAPVADVLSSADNTVIGDRSFGTDAAQVSNMVASVVAGFKEAGVYTCLKHFPGLGSTAENTQEGMAATESTLQEMQAEDFLPFSAGIDAGAEFVMVSHLSVPQITGDNTQSSLSSTVITDILRGELGYNGIVITDALNVSAITEYYTPDEACIRAIQAGADMLLMPESFAAAYTGLLDAVKNGTIPEERINESLRRIYRVKYADQAASSTL